MRPAVKPDLAIMIGHQLAKKGKAKYDPMPDAESEDGPVSGQEEAKDGDESMHLEEIMGDFLQAMQDKDPKAMADLFKEAFECCESYPHDEAEEDEG